MTRKEDNAKIIDKMIELSEGKPYGTYEEMVVFQLATITAILADISKSLAVIADKTESEVDNG
jgi:hypothetical protein